VVIEAGHKNFPDSESLVTMDDVASYERINGPVPRGAIVFLTSRKLNTAPRFSDDALQFLGEARDIVGVGGVGTQIFSSAGESYVARKGIYELANVTNVSLLPRSGGIALAAPQKVVGANEEPVRLMALLR
jgi:kynurenine formamidase